MKQVLLLFFSFIVFYIPGASASEPPMPPGFLGTGNGNTSTGTTTTGGTTTTTTGGDTSGRGANPGHVMMGSAIVKNLASFAFDAEEQQIVNGAIDITVGGYLIYTSCPSLVNTVGCIYGISSVLNGGASIYTSRKSKQSGLNLGGGYATAGGTTSGLPGNCNPFTDPNCRVIHCNQNPNDPICKICPSGSACPASGVCPNGSRCGQPSNNNDGCPGGLPCINGNCLGTNISCNPLSDGDNDNDGCPDGHQCLSNNVCSDGSTPCTYSNNNNDGCPDGLTCLPTNFCSDGHTPCNHPSNTNRDISCDDNPNQAKCRTGGPREDHSTDPCIDILGKTCDEVTREACLQMSPQCRITPPDGNPVFYDPDGNPINPGSLDDIGRQLGLTPQEIQDTKNDIENIQQKVKSQIGSRAGSKGGIGMKGHRGLSSGDSNEALSTTGVNGEFKPSLSGGGGSSANNRNKRGQKSSQSPSFSRQLQSLLDQQKNNHQSSIKKHGYKPAKLGNQPIGTAHDNIFDMMSRGYQDRENSLDVR